MERHLGVNLLGPGPRLMKKEFTGPRSHKGWETLLQRAVNPVKVLTILASALLGRIHVEITQRTSYNRADRHATRGSRAALEKSICVRHLNTIHSEANWFAASQEIPRISRNSKVHYRTHKRPPPVSILDQPNPHPTSWRSNLILSTHLRLGLPSGLLPSGFPSKTPYTPFSSPIRATCPTNLVYSI